MHSNAKTSEKMMIRRRATGKNLGKSAAASVRQRVVGSKNQGKTGVPRGVFGVLLTAHPTLRGFARMTDAGVFTKC